MYYNKSMETLFFVLLTKGKAQLLSRHLRNSKKQSVMHRDEIQQKVVNMSMQYMEPQDESEYRNSYSQQKLHPRSRQRPGVRTIVVRCFVLLWIVFAASILVVAVTSPSSPLGTVAGWLFLSLFFILALWSFAKFFVFDWHWPHRVK